MGRSLVFSSILGLTLLAGVLEHRVLASDVEDAVAIFGKLGLPSVKGKRFARLNTGESWKNGNDELVFQYVTGWVISEDANGVELLTPGLVQERIKRDRSLPPDWEKHRAKHPADMPLPGELEDVDFEQLSRDLVAGAREPRTGFEAMARTTVGEFPRYGEACLHAWWERERGETELASQLSSFATRAFEEERKARQANDAPATLVVAVATDVAENRRWQAINRANKGAPRKELLERWKLIAEVLPHTSWTDEAKTSVERYSSLLEEDAKWTEPAKDDLEKGTPAERVAHWIYKLRELPARQWSQPGGVYILGRLAGLQEGEPNPAEELVKLRWDAVPAVIESLTDGRPTRSMGYGRDFKLGSFYLLTIGDCCATVFQAITGEEIYRQASTTGAMTKEGRARAAQELAREWWKKVKDKGELRYLVEAVSSGDPNRVGVAGRLAERYPEAALAAIKDGIAWTKDERLRAWLVAVASWIEKADPTELLEAEAASSRPLAVRIAATEGLLRRGKSAALGPMLRAWKELPSDAREHSESLAKLLLGSEEPEAFRAIGEDLAHRSLAVRMVVIANVGYALRGYPSWKIDPKVAAGRSQEEAAKARVAWQAAAEDLLAASLEDEDEHTGGWGMRGSQSWKDPRICDLAADELVSSWPQRYSFDLSASLSDRDRSRSAMRQSYRRSRGLAPLTDDWPEIPPEDRPRVEAALNAFCAGDGDRRTKATAELEAIGVSGLAAIETRIATLGAAPVARELAAVATRLSSTVVAAVASSETGDFPEPLRARLAATLRKPLTGSAFVELVTAAVRERPASCRRIKMTAERASDGSGVLVQLAFGSEPQPRSAGSTPVENRTIVILGRESIATLAGGGTEESVRSPDVHQAACSALERCLASAPRTSFHARVTLSFFGDRTPERPAAKPATGSAKLDSQGDPLPLHARARFGSLRFRHADSVECVAWTPDRKMIVSGSRDNTVRVWDAENGRELRRLESGNWLVFDVAVSPDGKLVAAGCGDKNLRVWNLASGASHLVVPHPDQVWGVAFSPDGKLLASACSDGSVRFYRAESGDCLRQVVVGTKDQEGHGYFWPKLRWLDAETLAVCGIDDKIHFVRGENVTDSAPLGRKIWRFDCSADGSKIAATGRKDRTLVLYDTKKKTFTTHDSGESASDGPWPVVFSPDGKVIAAADADDGQVRRWDAETGAALESLEGIKSTISDLAFSSDGKRIVGGSDGHDIHVWDTTTRKLVSGAATAGQILALAVSPDGKTIVVGDRGSTLLFLDSTTLEVKQEADGWTGVSLAFSPDGKHLVGGIGGTVSVWNGTTGALEQQFKGLKPQVHGVAFSGDGDTYAASDRDEIHLYSFSGRKELRKLSGGDCLSLAFSPDGKLLAKGRGHDFGASIYDVASGEERFGLEEPSDVCAVAFTPDGKTLATGTRGPNATRIALWNPSTGKSIRTFDTADPVRCIAFSPDGALLAIGCQGVGHVVGKSLGIWDVATGERLVDLQGHAAFITGLGFAKDGRTLFSSSVDGVVIAWEVPGKAR